MKNWPTNSPEVHQAFLKGAFVGRRADGCHNGVSADIVLEQTWMYMPRKSGLDGIILHPAASNKWFYTKPITVALSSQLKSMLHLSKDENNPHHEIVQSHVDQDVAML